MSSIKNEKPKAGRPKELTDDVDKVHFSLTPEEQLVLQTIRMRRKKRSDGRTNNSQIVADALWKVLIEEEKVPREYITRLSEIEMPETAMDTNVTEITKKGKL